MVTIAVVVSLLAIAAGLLRRCNWARVLGNVFLVVLSFVLLGCVYLSGKHKTLFRRSAW